MLADEARAVFPDRGEFGVYARNLGTGETVEVDADAAMPTASAAKTFILVHYSRLVTSGALDPHRRVTVTAGDHALGSGVLRFLEPGVALTLDDLAWLMIIVSDNVATDVLLREVGGAERVNATMTSLGLPTAQVNPEFKRSEDLGAWVTFGTATPRDLAEVYTHLDDRCRLVLGRQQFIDGLPRALPHASQAVDWSITMPVRVYNKTGGDPGIYTDAGLFETDTSSWVAAVMAKDLWDLAGPDGAGATTAGRIGVLLYERWGS